MLHGQGGDERSMWVFARTIPQEWLVVAPRGPEPEPGGGWSWRVAQQFGNGFANGGPDPTSPDSVTRLPSLDLFAPHTDTLADFVQSLTGAYGADPEATYLAGFSQGTAAAYCLALLRSGLTSSIAGLYGFFPEANHELFAGRPLTGVRIWAAFGEADPYISRAISLHAVDRLVAAGADVETHAYAGGHKLPRVGMRDLAAWWRTL
jgi:phospholipase/carboxylesterase